MADFAAIIEADTTRVTASHGDPPPDDELRAMALWAVAPLSSPVGAHEVGSGSCRPEPRAWPPPRWSGPAWCWWSGGSPRCCGPRERQWIAIMAELADHGWRELD